MVLVRAAWLGGVGGVGASTFSLVVPVGEDSAFEEDLTNLSGWPDGELSAMIAAVEAAVPMEVDPTVGLRLPGGVSVRI